MIRNQRDDEIPKLFLYSQLLLALSKNEAKYGTTGTAAKFWAVWKEEMDADAVVKLVNTRLRPSRRTGCSATVSQYVRAYFETWSSKPRESPTRTGRSTASAGRSGCWN